MFAQLMITCILVVTVAEVLCRVILRQSSFTVVRDFFLWVDQFTMPRPADLVPHPPASPSELSQGEVLRRTLSERRRQLAATQAELRLKQRTAEVTEQLLQTEEDLARVEERLAGASLVGTAGHAAEHAETP